MTIICDTREHKEELYRILYQFDRIGVSHEIHKLDVGDYMIKGKPNVVIDRKKDLGELCSNVTQQHERFRRELIRAKAASIRFVILCEHGGSIHTIEDVKSWHNPRSKISPKAVRGEQLYHSLCTIRDRYGVDICFCDKRNTGRKIVEILEDSQRGSIT